MKLSLVFLSLLFFPALSCAAYGERWYNVEVIIFSYSSDMGVQEEHWPLETGVPDISNAVSLVKQDNSSERLPGQILEFEQLPFKMLSGALRRMQRSSRYDVIYANAWRLPDLPKRRAPPVRIKAGKRYNPDGGPAAPFLGEIAGQLSGMSDEALYEIDGRIKISLSKFLDVDADLLYRRNVNLPDAQGLPVNEFREFRLTEFRRMKSKTIHYLDHPMFGVVIGIDRYKADTGEDEPEMAKPRSASEINQ